MERFTHPGLVPAHGIDLGFAPPGVDEEVLIHDLISALHNEAAGAAVEHPKPSAPVLAAFHVGITRVEGDGIRGSAVTRILRLLPDLALVTPPSAVPAATLVVGMSASLFGDINTEHHFSSGWVPLRNTEALCRVY